MKMGCKYELGKKKGLKRGLSWLNGIQNSEGRGCEKIRVEK